MPEKKNCISIIISISSSRSVSTPLSGADPEGGGGVLWGTQKLHKEGKNVTRMHANIPHFST